MAIKIIKKNLKENAEDVLDLIDDHLFQALYLYNEHFSLNPINLREMEQSAFFIHMREEISAYLSEEYNNSVEGIRNAVDTYLNIYYDKIKALPNKDLEERLVGIGYDRNTDESYAGGFWDLAREWADEIDKEYGLSQSDFEFVWEELYTYLWEEVYERNLG